LWTRFSRGGEGGLAHAWNKNHPDERMGLLHVVFAAFNVEWRHSTMAYLSPVDRMGTLSLDALLGQLNQSYGNANQGWVTEVVSPILSKAMALELSPWLFAAMHQGRFADLEQWIKERAWVVLRLPSGEMGREGALLFVLAQSLSMMRRVEGFEPVVQSLLANTSTQAFFSPDPEDADAG
jgi:hypothetical protein